MTNQIKIGLDQNIRVITNLPLSGGNGIITAGMPCLWGTMACVAMDSDTTANNVAGSPVSFWFDGDYGFTVIAQSTQSPVSGEQINPGDELYASGTFDATSGVTYNLTIDKTRGNCPFGNYTGDGPITSGTTNTYASVRLKTGGSPGPYAS